MKRKKSFFQSIRNAIFGRELPQQNSNQEENETNNYMSNKEIKSLEKAIVSAEETIRKIELIRVRKETLAQKQAQIEKLKHEAAFKKLEAKALARERAKARIEEEKLKKKKPDTRKWQDNAFLRGRAAWNDMYGSLVERNRKNFTVSVLLAIALLASVIGIIHMGSQSKIQPFMVQVGQNGDIVDVSSAEKAPDITEKIIKYFLQKFVINMHSISGDNIVQKQMLAFVYSSVNTSGNSNAMNILKSFIQNNNPFTLNSQFTNQVNISSLYPISKDSYQITWEEVKRTIDGKLVSKNYYTGQIAYKFAPSSGENFTYNPFGIYITNMAWSQVQTEQEKKA